MNSTIVAIAPSKAEHNRTLIEKKSLDFEILHDPRNEIAHAYGLRWSVPDDLKTLYGSFKIDLEAANGDDSWTLPMPARFIIDPAGSIRYAEFDPDYTRRPEPARTLEAVRGLGQ